jgi:hypothetical protein
VVLVAAPGRRRLRRIGIRLGVTEYHTRIVGVVEPQLRSEAVGRSTGARMERPRCGEVIAVGVGYQEVGDSLTRFESCQEGVDMSEIVRTGIDHRHVATAY